MSVVSVYDRGNLPDWYVMFTVICRRLSITFPEALSTVEIVMVR
jgi:hypothetical protein